VAISQHGWVPITQGVGSKAILMSIPATVRALQQTSLNGPQDLRLIADAPLYLRECARVLAPDGRVYLSTAPYLSFAGAHLPRLKIPVPLHLLFGRRIAFATFTFLARHATWLLKEPANENSFIKLARKGEIKHDDLLEKVTVSSLRSHIAAAGLKIVREELHFTATIRRLPTFVSDALREDGLTRDIFISNMEYVLEHAGSGA